jgi:hypothetical protein
VSLIEQEATILTTNRHNDTLFTLLMKNHEVFMETRQLFFQIFIGMINNSL